MRLSPLLALALAACSPSAPNPGGSPSCSAGGLGCLCVDGACTCTGARACTSVCADHCAVACTGAGCSSACGVDCTASCTGASPCSFHTGMGSTITCTGTGACDATCEGGGCTLTCSTTGGCSLSCPSGGDCTIPFCPDVVHDCGHGLQVCGRDCPLLL